MQFDVQTNIYVFKLNLIVDFYVGIGYSRMFFKDFHKMDRHPVILLPSNGQPQESTYTCHVRCTYL